MTGEQTEHYFDWAATSPADRDILSSALNITLDAWGNPSSLHSAGKEARELLENARNLAAKTLGVPSSTLFFTSGGTEANHIPLLSVLNRPQKKSVLFSSIEHPAVREMALQMKKCGIETIAIPAEKSGIVTAESVLKCLSPQTVMICIMAVNNETGAIQPVAEIVDAVENATRGKRRPKIHVDCVQAAGKIPLDLKGLKVDSASISAHKISGPRGIGLLYAKDTFEPFLKGGGQESGIRSGTENVYGAICLSKCLEKYFIREKSPRYMAQVEFTRKFIASLVKIPSCTIIPECRIENEDRFSPWIVQASFKGIPGQVMMRALDAEGFYISTGSACSAKKSNRPVLDAMNVSHDVSENAVRFSFGHSTTEEAMTALAEKISEIARRFQ
ncbi:MAG: cysteine desulfurase [Treponema sp.]|nr:cysteine desulfurase [Treponema sp.]